jgi:ATP-binding cassette subfamily B (MDR/TAP) protein 1
MAADSAIINGASSEALGPYCEAITALGGGLVIGFIFCWQEALITLACVPFIAVGNFIAMTFEKGLSGATGDSEKAANLLIGDAINNFKTVQSFGNEEMLVKKYRSFVDPIFKASRAKHINAGIAYGFSQFIIYLIMAALFFFGGMVIEDNCEEIITTLPDGT